MKGYLLDTHSWLWAQMRKGSEVSSHYFDEVEIWQKAGDLYISDISVLEIARLAAAKYVDLDTTIDLFVEEATTDNGFRLLPLTTRILIESTRLPGEIHRDPSDRLLVATAREHGLTLITRDKNLLAYSKLGHLNARKP